jgi:hypothetical protein
LSGLSIRGVAWTTHGQNPCDFRPGPGCYGGSGYRASSRTDVPLGRCPRHTPFGPCWRFSVFSLSTSTLWAKAGVPVLRLRSSVSRDCGVGWKAGWKGAGSPDGTKLLRGEPGSAAVDARRSRAGGGVPPRPPTLPFFPHWVVLRLGRGAGLGASLGRRSRAGSKREPDSRVATIAEMRISAV